MSTRILTYNNASPRSRMWIEHLTPADVVKIEIGNQQSLCL